MKLSKERPEPTHSLCVKRIKEHPYTHLSSLKSKIRSPLSTNHHAGFSNGGTTLCRSASSRALGRALPENESARLCRPGNPRARIALGGPPAAVRPRDEGAPPSPLPGARRVTRAHGSAPPPSTRRGGAGVCPGSGCLQLTAACKVAAADPEQDGAAAGSWSWRRRGRGSRPWVCRGRQVGVQSRARPQGWPRRGEGCVAVMAVFTRFDPFSFALVYGRRGVLRGPRPRGRGDPGARLLSPRPSSERERPSAGSRGGKGAGGEGLLGWAGPRPGLGRAGTPTPRFQPGLAPSDQTSLS